MTRTGTHYVGNPLRFPEESQLLPGPILTSYFLHYGKEITSWMTCQGQEKASLDSVLKSLSHALEKNHGFLSFPF